MPICVKEGLPAIETLANENIFIMSENRARNQDIRALKILVVNLMPTVIDTETQILRLLSNTSLQLNVDFLRICTHISKDDVVEHLQQFYLTFNEIKKKNYDGMIITGAPVEKIKFEQVDFWEELCEVMEWSKSHVYSSIYICWAAQAALYYHYGLDKSNLSNKLSGVYSHTVSNHEHPIVRGFDDLFLVPHSRYTSIEKEAVLKNSELDILAESKEAGVYLIADKSNTQLFVTGHCEFDRFTLKTEYIRDFLQGLNPKGPENYDLGVETSFSDRSSWSSHASLLFSNWLNYFVYQQTPYCLNEISHRQNREFV